MKAGTTEQTNSVIEAGFVDVLLECISNKRSRLDVKAQAAWALGNVAGEAPSYREELMCKGFSSSIVTVLDSIYEEAYDESTYGQHEKGRMRFADEEDYSNVEALLWALSNMSRGGFRVAEYFRHVRLHSTPLVLLFNLTCFLLLHSTCLCLRCFQNTLYLITLNSKLKYGKFKKKRQEKTERERETYAFVGCISFLVGDCLVFYTICMMLPNFIDSTIYQTNYVKDYPIYYSKYQHIYSKLVGLI